MTKLDKNWMLMVSIQFYILDTLNIDNSIDNRPLYHTNCKKPLFFVSMQATICKISNDKCSQHVGVFLDYAFNLSLNCSELEKPFNVKLLLQMKYRISFKSQFERLFVT